MLRLDTGASRLTLTATAICLVLTQSARAERFNDTLEPNDSNWSNAGNWVDGLIADNNAEIAEIGAGDPVIDADFTVRELRTVFAETGVIISGPGTLTIDRNAATTSAALLNQSGSGAVMEFDGNLAINNTNATPARTVMRNTNNIANLIRFNPTSVLTLQTGLEVQTGIGGFVQFNGRLAGPADLFFSSNNATFGATADNTGYEGDLVFFANALAVSNLVGGTLIDSTGKIQVNGNGSRIEINGAETFFGSVNVGGVNNFTFDADANQSSMGTVGILDGILTLDVDAAVTELAFANSSAVVWGAGSVSIVGFKEDTIRFGTDATGLTAGQLAAINGGIYSLNSQGYLTTMSNPNLPGDANDDGKVDLLDLDILGANFGATSGATVATGDFNADGAVDLLDLDILGANFGSMAPSAVTVPEPTGALLVFALLVAGSVVVRLPSKGRRQLAFAQAARN